MPLALDPQFQDWARAIGITDLEDPDYQRSYQEQTGRTALALESPPPEPAPTVGPTLAERAQINRALMAGAPGQGGGSDTSPNTNPLHWGSEDWTAANTARAEWATAGVPLSMADIMRMGAVGAYGQAGAGADVRAFEDESVDEWWRTQTGDARRGQRGQTLALARDFVEGGPGAPTGPGGTSFGGPATPTGGPSVFGYSPDAVQALHTLGMIPNSPFGPMAWGIRALHALGLVPPLTVVTDPETPTPLSDLGIVMPPVTGREWISPMSDDPGPPADPSDGTTGPGAGGTGGSGDPAAYHAGGPVKDVQNKPGGEETVTAKQGEYIINQRATKKYLPLIRAINEDRPDQIVAYLSQAVRHMLRARKDEQKGKKAA